MSHENTWIARQSRVAAVILFLLLAHTTAFSQGTPEPAETEKAVTGTVEIGERYRWFAGNSDLYRSIVNLNSGARVHSFSTTYKANDGDKVHWVDRFTIQGSGWGGDPNRTLNFTTGLSDRYEFRLNYRHFDYFNSVPTFANPTPGRTGATQSFLNIVRPLVDSQLTIRPYARVSPHVAYESDAAKGPGRTNFVQDANEYAVATFIDNATYTYRGGVSLRFNHWSGGVEAGGSTFRDRQLVEVSGANLGNRATLFLGQRLELDSLQQKYDVSGKDRFFRSYGETHVGQKLSLTGQFSYSRPTATNQYFDAGSGKFVLLETLQTFTDERTITHSDARYPHPSGAFGADFRLTERIRIVETLSVDRYRIAGSSSTTQAFVPAETLNEGDSSSLKASFNRQRLDVMVDLTRFASIHAGHTFLDASAVSPGSVLTGSQTHDVQKNQVDLGLALKFQTRFRGNVDYQESRGDTTFFRTDKLTFRRIRARGRYEINRDLQIGISTTLWNNKNTASDVLFFENSRESSVDVTFTPDSGKRFRLSTSYTRGTFRSDLPFIVPQNYQTEHSIYRDRGHTGSLSLNVNAATRLEVQAGGSLYISTSPLDDGTQTRPTRFYNPYARLTFKAGKAMSFISQWDWHGYSNRAFERESYRAHLLTTGVAYRF